MNNYYKKVEILMLPTEYGKGSPKIFISKEFPEIMQLGKDNKNVHWNPQHLYVISNVQIQEGDWAIGVEVGFSGKERNYYVWQHIGNTTSKLKAICYGSKKIIATTDIHLGWVKLRRNEEDKLIGNSSVYGRSIFKPHLPELPESFIKHFVESYNLGKLIKTMNVKYKYVQLSIDKEKVLKEQLKVSKNNSIKILGSKINKFK